MPMPNIIGLSAARATDVNSARLAAMANADAAVRFMLGSSLCGTSVADAPNRGKQCVDTVTGIVVAMRQAWRSSSVTA